MKPNTTISCRGTVRTNSPLVALYYRILKGHRLAARWYRPSIVWGSVMLYSPRYELRPALG